MGEGTGRRIAAVPGDGSLRSLFAAEVRRKGLPVDLEFVTSADRKEWTPLLKAKGLPVPEVLPLAGRDELLPSLKSFGLPALLRAHDGDRILQTMDDAVQALAAVNGHPLSLKRIIDAAAELSVTVVRSAAGELRSYPAAEQLRGSHLTIVPARIDAAVAAAAEDLARRAAEAIGAVGVVAVSLAVDRSGALLIREVSPRPEPSGHYTLEACRTSQYEQHVRAVAGMAPGDTTLLYAAVTATIVGAPGLNGPFVLEGVEGVRSIPGAAIQLYDVKETAPGRPLGAVTLVDVNDPQYRDALVHRADHARRMIVQKEIRK